MASVSQKKRLKNGEKMCVRLAKIIRNSVNLILNLLSVLTTKFKHFVLFVYLARKFQVSRVVTKPLTAFHFEGYFIRQKWVLPFPIFNNLKFKATKGLQFIPVPVFQYILDS